MTANEAAERLRRLGYLEHTYSPEDGEPLAPLLDAALAAERRATVERIRAQVVATIAAGDEMAALVMALLLQDAIERDPANEAVEIWRSQRVDLAAILDEEAAR